ncbi:mucin-6-like [Bacillus rossius redtenbacheri]|uniref:mucin-6-like n=1 Tax=Bacillus rossius redtenbacheri TaxID=93214 RepID=UPI002FDCC88D
MDPHPTTPNLGGGDLGPRPSAEATMLTDRPTPTKPYGRPAKATASSQPSTTKLTAPGSANIKVSDSKHLAGIDLSTIPTATSSPTLSVYTTTTTTASITSPIVTAAPSLPVLVVDAPVDPMDTAAPATSDDDFGFVKPRKTTKRPLRDVLSSDDAVPVENRYGSLSSLPDSDIDDAASSAPPLTAKPRRTQHPKRHKTVAAPPQPQPSTSVSPPQPQPSTSQRPATSAPPAPKPPRMPPIGIRSSPTAQPFLHIKHLQSLLTGPLTATSINDRTSFYTANPHDHQFLYDHLKRHGYQPYTHLRPDERTDRVVVKRLPSSTTADEVKEALLDLGLPVGTVLPLRTSADSTTRPFLVCTNGLGEATRFLKLKTLGCWVVTVERYRGSGRVFQMRWAPLVARLHLYD